MCQWCPFAACVFLKVSIHSKQEFFVVVCMRITYNSLSCAHKQMQWKQMVYKYRATKVHLFQQCHSQTLKFEEASQSVIHPITLSSCRYMQQHINQDSVTIMRRHIRISIRWVSHFETSGPRGLRLWGYGISRGNHIRSATH